MELGQNCEATIYGKLDLLGLIEFSETVKIGNLKLKTRWNFEKKLLLRTLIMIHLKKIQDGVLRFKFKRANLGI